MEIKLARLPKMHRDAIAVALSIARQFGMYAYLVGGYVRDWLLGSPSDDLDIAVSGDPFAYGIALANAIGGTFVQMHDAPKVARVVKHDGRLWFDITGIATSLEDDLLSRDFTINSFAIPIDTIAPCDTATRAVLLFPEASECYEDLNRHIIRMHSGYEGKSIKDDPLRMLRAFRFAATLGFEIDQSVLDAIKAHCELLRDCAWERIRDEFAITLQSRHGSRMLAMMDEVGLLREVIWELEDLKQIPAEGYHHLDGFRHSLEAVRRVETILEGTWWIEDEWIDIAEALHEMLSPNFEQLAQPMVERRTGIFIVKMASLLHDIGKPKTMHRDEDGDLHFFGHEEVGGGIAEEICQRLKLSKKETQLITRAVRRHMHPLYLSQTQTLTERALRRFWMVDGDQVGLVIILVSLSDLLATRGPEMTQEQMLKHLQTLQRLMEVHEQLKATRALPKLLSGHDVMRRYGIPQGPLVGKALRIIREAQLSGRVRTKDEALSLLDKVMPKLLERNR